MSLPRVLSQMVYWYGFLSVLSETSPHLFEVTTWCYHEPSPHQNNINLGGQHIIAYYQASYW